MKVTFDKAERREQKEILRGLYSDYNPVYHDAFVDRYNKDLDATALRTYMINRGILHYRQENADRCRNTGQGVKEYNTKKTIKEKRYEHFNSHKKTRSKNV